MPATETLVPPDTDTPATTPILLQSIQLRNILSFGANTPELELRALNVLIGANGSGKSNLIDCIALLRSTPGDMGKVIWDGGGVQEWIHKGKPQDAASIRVFVQQYNSANPLIHHIAFRNRFMIYEFDDEIIAELNPATENAPPTHIYRLGEIAFEIEAQYRAIRSGATSKKEAESILSQLRDPIKHWEITYLADQYERIRIYRDWQFGRGAIVRNYVDASLPQATLAEDFSNLVLFLNRLCRDPKTKKTIVTYLRDIYDGVDDIGFDVVGGFIQLYLVEGNHTIPAKRLSDGTLHYLCLLAILCDPNPPPLICIEEPELGLHPDLLHKIADLLLDASTRTQLIVTTHSEIIVDAMTDRPESILICEKCDGQTSIERLNRDNLQIWLDKYRLGELWSSGELGGVRW